MQHEEGPGIPEDAKPAEIMLEDHGGRQRWLWTVPAASEECLLSPRPCQAFPGKVLTGTGHSYMKKGTDNLAGCTINCPESESDSTLELNRHRISSAYLSLHQSSRLFIPPQVHVG